MIIILTDQDLTLEARTKLAGEVNLSDIEPDKFPVTGWAEDVYLWRPAIVRALKRRNAPLDVPSWLQNAEGVDI